ncbi:MAG: leucine-rich repeat domain-containing protein [Bacteriovoracaceae bacterium]|jgi:hypothetical protein|nr:leucine-rich repeat domain-containing protein [Bacteriovoracaceae bacterium]
MKLVLLVSLIFSSSVFAGGICDRGEDVRNKLLKNLGMKRCADVTAKDLEEVTDLVIIYDWGNHKGDKTKMKTITKEDLAGLVNLNELVIQFSEIESLAEDTFWHLKNLRMLDFSHNLLKKFPKKLFAGQKDLRYLELDSNPMEGGKFPVGLFKGLESVVELDLDELGLTEIQPGLFSDLGNLKSLDLTENELNTFSADSFMGLRALEELEIQGNPLKGLDKSVFSKFPKGTVVYEWE